MMERILPSQLFDAICDLAKANYLTGYYDNTDFSTAKKPKEQFSTEEFYKFFDIRKNARKYVEERAKYRKLCELYFGKIANIRSTYNGNK